MIDKFNRWLTTRYIDSCSELSDFDKDRIEYALMVLLDETEKILGILIIFAMLNKMNDFLLSFIVLMSLRIFIGGIHFSTRARCFTFTLCFFLSIVYISDIIMVDKLIGIPVCGVALLNIVLCAPLSSKHRILVTERGKKNLKRAAIIVMAMWTVGYILLNVKTANIILWTVIMQQLEILYYKFFLRGGTTKDD